MREIDSIILHCSATPEGKDFTVEDIDRWHRQRGFAKIGYHYIIYRDGTVKTGRLVNEAGAHCVGHNLHSIGVCYIGGCTADGMKSKDTRTPEQQASLQKLLRQLHQEYPDARLYGHNHFAKKACPSFVVKESDFF